MTMMNHSVEMIIIGNMSYTRESNGSWQTQELGERSSLIWEKGYGSDQLAQQRSILLNATNVTMQKKIMAGYWTLYLIRRKWWSRWKRQVSEQSRKKN